MEKEYGFSVTFISEKREAAKKNLNALRETRKVLTKVAPEFKIVVADLRDFLEEIKEKLDAEESKLPNGEKQNAAALEILDIAEKIATDHINDTIIRINKIVSGFTSAQHHIHRSYFQRHIHPLLLMSPFARKAYLKPLGCPGDYEMMNMLYEDHDQGESLFARVMNRHSCRVAVAQSVIDRIPYILDKINDTIERVTQDRKEVWICSVGSGPAREIQELIRTNPRSNRCHVTLIDALQEALWHSNAKIFDLKLATGNEMKVRYLNRSVEQLIRDSSTLDALTGQDLIYTVGLFDYLPFHVAKQMVQKLYRHLSEEGELIIGNLDISNNCRYYMKYAAEWRLVHRTRAEMLRLAKEGIPPRERVFIKTVQRGTQLYLIIKKQKKAEASFYKYTRTGNDFLWKIRKTLSSFLPFAHIYKR